MVHVLIIGCWWVSGVSAEMSVLAGCEHGAAPDTTLKQQGVPTVSPLASAVVEGAKRASASRDPESANGLTKQMLGAKAFTVEDFGAAPEEDAEAVIRNLEAQARAGSGAASWTAGVFSAVAQQVSVPSSLRYARQRALRWSCPTTNRAVPHSLHENGQLDRLMFQCKKEMLQGVRALCRGDTGGHRHVIGEVLHTGNRAHARRVTRRKGVELGMIFYSFVPDCHDFFTQGQISLQIATSAQKILQLILI